MFYNANRFGLSKDYAFPEGSNASPSLPDQATSMADTVRVADRRRQTRRSGGEPADQLVSGQLPGRPVPMAPSVQSGRENLVAAIRTALVTGGIAEPADLKPDQTPAFLYSFALDGDLYASAPVGEEPVDGRGPTGSSGDRNLQHRPGSDIHRRRRRRRPPAGPGGQRRGDHQRPDIRRGRRQRTTLALRPFVPTVVNKIRQLAAQRTGAAKADPTLRL